MKDTKIIGLAGPAGVGKSYLAQGLKSRTRGEIFSFAANIKLGLYCMGLDVSYKDKEAVAYKGKSTRKLLQSLGTDWGRNMVGPDIWVDLLMKRIDQDDAHLAIIDDVRFDNEADAIHERGGVVIELERPGIYYSEEHASETPLDPCLIDLTIDCTRTAAAVAEILTRKLS